jgi:hypothetical protein
MSRPWQRLWRAATDVVTRVVGRRTATRRPRRSTTSKPGPLARFLAQQTVAVLGRIRVSFEVGCGTTRTAAPMAVGLWEVLGWLMAQPRPAHPQPPAARLLRPSDTPTERFARKVRGFWAPYLRLTAAERVIGWATRPAPSLSLVRLDSLDPILATEDSEPLPTSPSSSGSSRPAASIGGPAHRLRRLTPPSLRLPSRWWPPPLDQPLAA